MPRKNKEKVLSKLVNYIKKDRPRKFKDCVKKYEVDLRNIVLSKGRTLLHCAAKYDGHGSFISYLLQQGVSARQPDRGGNLPLHIAVHRALSRSPCEASQVYRAVVVPLLQSFPGAVGACDEEGTDMVHLLTILNQHIVGTHTSPSSHSHSSDSESSDRQSANDSPQEQWRQRLAAEFESEAADFFGRYDYSDDMQQEQQKETFTDWSERMGREMHHRRCPPAPPPSTGRKRKQDSGQHDGHHSTAPKHPHRETGRQDSTHRQRQTHQDTRQTQEDSTQRERQSYEDRFQSAVADRSGKELSYGDIPWPSRGSVDHVMHVLYGDKASWSVADLRKFTRQQQVRWHPDKFLQKFVDRLAPRSFEKVMGRVKEISQALNNKAQTLSTTHSHRHPDH